MLVPGRFNPIQILWYLYLALQTTEEFYFYIPEMTASMLVKSFYRVAPLA